MDTSPPPPAIPPAAAVPQQASASSSAPPHHHRNDHGLAHSQSSPMVIDIPPTQHRPRQQGASLSPGDAGGGKLRYWLHDNPNYKNRGHTERAFQTLNLFRKNGQLCDIILVAGPSPEERAESEVAEVGEGERVEITAHRSVLAACCPYFCAMFTGEMTETRQTRVYIQGINARALATLVDYIYSAEIHITEDNVQLLLPAASLLQLVDVRTACCEFLKSQLHPSNCLGIRAFADVHACQDLLNFANAFTEQHFA